MRNALQGYRKLNVKAFEKIKPGGILFTFSCSGAVDAELFQKIVAGAVIDSGVNAWLVGRMGAGADHPLLMTYPEGEYLKGLDILVRP